MSYEQLAASVDALADANTALTEQALATQEGSIAASNTAVVKAQEAAVSAVSAEESARVAQEAANLAKDSTDIMDSVEAGIAAGKPYFYTISEEDSQVLVLWKNEGGVAEDTGKRTPSATAVEELEAKSRFTYYTNTLYATGYESGKFTGSIPNPTKVSAAIVTNDVWSSIGIRKALRLDVISGWSGVEPKVIYDANILADKQATIALNPSTPADFHAGDTINFRMLYRSNKEATCAIAVIKSDGQYDSIAGGLSGRINMPSTGGAVSEIKFSVVSSSLVSTQAILCPRIYGLDPQTFISGDYIEVVDMVMQKQPIKIGINYKHPTKDDILQQTTELAEKTAAKSRFTYYTNTMYATGFEGDNYTGAAPNPTKATIGLVSNDKWSLVGIRKALRIELITPWADTAVKALYDANVLTNKMASISLTPATVADFHAGDTINFRMKYRSNREATCALIIFKADGTYDSTAGGSISAKTLANTNGEISEISFSVVANSANAAQAFVSPRIYGIDTQTFNTGDYIEVVDMVMQKPVISTGINYKHPTRDELLRYNTAPAGKNLFDKSKVVPGKQVSGTGAVVTSATSTLSPYIPVTNARSLAISGLQNNPGVTRFYAFYAKDKTTVVSAGGFIAAGANSGVVEVPNGAAWFLVTVKRTNTDPDNNNAVQIEAGRFSTAYTSYVEGINGLDSVPFVPDTVAVPKSSANMAFLGFGDSITTTGTWTDAGVYTDLGTRPWTKIVRDLLPMGSLINYARSGAAYRDRSAPIIDSDWQKISHQVLKAIEFNTPADVVFIACGTNDGPDVLGDYDTAMSKTTLESLDRTKLYEALRWTYWTISKNWPKAVYFAVTPIQRADATPESLEPLYTAIKKMASRYNFIIIDATTQSGIIKDFEVPGGVGRWLKDGLHPSDPGHVKYSECPLRAFNYNLNW